MLYKDWLDEWLETYIKPTCKTKTYDRYSEIVSGHISRIGDTDMNELTPIVLQKFVVGLMHDGNMRTGQGLSASSVNGIITLIQNSLRAAFESGVADEYTANKIKRPKSIEKKVECFSSIEQKKIERAVFSEGSYKHFGILLCLYTGLRIGELLALKWTDIDLKHGVISVCRSCHDGKDKNGVYMRIVESPKTPTSTRIIPLPKQLIGVCKNLKRSCKSEYVIAKNAKPVHVRNYQKSFEALLKRLDIPHRGFHALRHTFATRALECGMDVKTLSEILGHKNPTVTLNRYVHSLMEHKRDMMNKLGRLMVIPK